MKMMMIIISIFFTSYAFAGEIFDQNQSFMVASYPSTLAIGDLNHDKMDDIVIVYWASNEQLQVWIYYQTKCGDFLEPEKIDLDGVHVRDIAIADINKDNHNDLLVGHSTPQWLGVFYQNRKTKKLCKEIKYPIQSVTYPHISYCAIFHIRIADLNGDKRLDIVTKTGLQEPDFTITIFLQEKGKLKLYKKFGVKNAYAMELVDIDNDGEIEILTTGRKESRLSAYNAMKVFNKDGELKQEITYRGESIDFKATNLDGNDYPDLIIGNFSDRRVLILQQDANGFKEYFSYRMDSQAHQVAVGDANNDGLLDILVSITPGQSDTCKILAFTQNKDNTFELTDTYESFDRIQGLTIADVMQDKKNDVLFLTEDNPLGTSYLYAFFKNPSNPKSRHPKKSKSKARGIERAIEVVSKSGSAKALGVLESKAEESAIEQTISAETEEDVPEVLNGKDEDEIILTNTIEAIDRKNTEKPPFKCISIAIFRVWAKVIELGKVYYLKDGKLEEFN